jgi:hypothetical protein
MTPLRRSKVYNVRESSAKEGMRMAILIQKARGVLSKAKSGRSEQKYCKAITKAVVNQKSWLV